jgi:SAM-dependent methyltransferase
MAKDNFSKQSRDYAAFRPVFPDAVYQFILQQVQGFDLAWDVATGNGQSAIKIAPYFRSVIATDISQNQVAHAHQLPNIDYRVEAAEHASLEDHSADLVIISQALHWMDFDPFYQEVKRVAKPGGIFAALVYSLIEVDDPVINNAIHEFYLLDSAPFWDSERHWVDEGYRGIPFPFEEIAAPEFTMEYEWRVADVLGYINTWSACQHYLKQTGRNLVEENLLPSLAKVSPGKTVRLRFPVYARIGKV